MRYFFTVLLVGIASQSIAQTACDSVTIVDVRYHAFTDTLINVYTTNANQVEFFSYPGFILRNNTGDSIAAETVNYFGIGAEQVSGMIPIDGLSPITDEFIGTLELWTGFYEEQACIFPIQESLCPTTVCNDLTLQLANFGDGPISGTFTYIVTPSAGGVPISGQLELDTENQEASVPLCLPNGSYTISMGPDDGPTGGQPYMTLYEDGPYNSPAFQMPITFDGSTVMEVPLYLPCIAEPNAIADVERNLLQIKSLPQGILVETTEQGTLSVIDMSGRVVSVMPINRTAVLQGLSKGVFLIVVDAKDGSRQTVKVAEP